MRARPPGRRMPPSRRLLANAGARRTHLRKPAAVWGTSEAITCHMRSPDGPARPVNLQTISRGPCSHCDARPPPPLERRLIDRWLIDRWLPEAPYITL